MGLPLEYQRNRASSLPSIYAAIQRKLSKETDMPRMMTAARAGFRYKKRESTPTPKTHKSKNRSRANSVLSLTPSLSQSNLCSSNASSVASLSAGNSLTVPDGHLRKRSGSVPALKIVTLASTWNLKHEQVRALKMTWSRLCEPPRSNCKGIVALVERVWERIDHKDKMIKEIFYKAAFVDSMTDRTERRCSKGSIATLRDHTHFFVSIVSQTISRLDSDPTEIFEHIDKIGRQHAYLKKYGFRSQHWEKIGEYFIDIVVIQDCVRGFPEACRAWTILIAAMVDRLRAAPRRGSVATSLVDTPATSSTSININNSGGSPMGSQFRIYGSGIIRTNSQDFREKEIRCTRRECPRNSSCISMETLEKSLPEVRNNSNPAIA